MNRLLYAIVVLAGLNSIALATDKSTDAGLSDLRVQDIRGIDLGARAPTVFVARDSNTWNAVKQAVGKPQMIPKGMTKGDGLSRLDDIDFQKQMIVAVFWGEMSFSGQGEKCWIEAVTTGKEEVTVDCRAILWGGAVKRAYRAWPYHVKVVPRSDLPLRFTQTTEWKADPNRSEKNKTLAVLKAGEWKCQVPADGK